METKDGRLEETSHEHRVEKRNGLIECEHCDITSEKTTGWTKEQLGAIFLFGIQVTVSR